MVLTEQDDQLFNRKRSSENLFFWYILVTWIETLSIIACVLNIASADSLYSFKQIFV